ncbi:ANTAR domain-containing protein [Paenibacillus aurantius]|uniref:ANTAR domain-containing protein n=1 Tax=Paenibacillus aurantius TaxID=2918900 RepID=A0AA96LGE3_9BACL|nr:ANTAR domain-containing protein [Paenibacillus aurantius]WNQ12803.1 ANTAR domain-containing protein [Paenibacillus aurantius]
MTLTMLLIDEIHSADSAVLRQEPAKRPHSMLASCGYEVRRVPDLSSLPEEGKADAVVLRSTPERLVEAGEELRRQSSLPLLWWYDGGALPEVPYDQGAEWDGMLSASMTADEVRWSVGISLLSFRRKERLRMENDQLTERLNDRRWIEQAKEILCEIKKIPEAEAYEFLRKQAMNERKKLVDVAKSIVKVYQLLRQMDKGGARS